MRAKPVRGALRGSAEEQAWPFASPPALVDLASAAAPVLLRAPPPGRGRQESIERVGGGARRDAISQAALLADAMGIEGAQAD